MVLMITTMLSGGAALLAMYAGETGNFLMFLAAVGLFGGFSVPLYSLCIAYTNDYLETDKMVAASSGLIFANGVGAIFGPLIVGQFMTFLGSEVFFAWIAGAHIAVGIFAIYRMQMNRALPMEDQGSFVAMPVRAGAAVVTLNPETEEWVNDEPPAYQEAEAEPEGDAEQTEIMDDGPALGSNNP
jgi:MFS family permease